MLQTFSGQFLSNDYQDIYSWLMGLRIISCELDEVPQKFVDGTLFCKIIQKLEGRSCTLGFHSAPKTFSACRANLKQALDYLRKYPKFRSQNLWSYEQVLHGDGETIWSILNDIKRFYPKYSPQFRSSIMRPSSVPAKSQSHIRSLSPDKRYTLSQLETQTVRTWLSGLGLAYLLQPGVHFLKDPLRNGVLVCKVLSQVKGKFDFFSHPQNVEEVLENIKAALFEVKSEISGYSEDELIEEKNVWPLLHKIMNCYKTTEVLDLPYSPAEIKNLQHSIFKWVFSLKIFDQSYPENFSMLCRSFRTGVALVKICEKLLKKKIDYLKYPNTAEECVRNIETAFGLLKKNDSMSKGFLWDPLQVYKGNSIYILALLEDFHRFASSLPPRKIGEDYHSDGPFYGKQLNFNISYNEEKSVWNPNSVYLSPEKSFHAKSMISSRTVSPIPYRTGFRSSLEVSQENISPKVKKEKQFNIESFEWIENIGIKLPKTLDIWQEKISEFKTGEILCQILQKLETKNFPGVTKAKKGTGGAVKNVNIAFEVLRKKPSFALGTNFFESEILKGNGEEIRKLLKEIYRIYRNSIVALMKFNRTYHL